MDSYPQVSFVSLPIVIQYARYIFLMHQFSQLWYNDLDDQKSMYNDFTLTLQSYFFNKDE